MKKTLLFLSVLIAGLCLNAQVVLNETFSAGTMPPAGWSIDAQASNWSASQSANAGSSSPEAKMSWSPQFNTTTRLISPSMNLSGSSTVLLQFKQMIDHYSGNYQIGVAIRSNGGVWSNAWTRTVTTSYASEQISVAINDAIVNSADFQFCIFFSGNSYNLNDWYIDDILLTKPASTDAAISSINIPTYFTGATNLSTTVTNMGLTSLSSFRVSWQVDDFDVYTGNVIGQNLTLGESMIYTFTDPVDVQSGIYSLKVWVDQVNGLAAADDVPENDTLDKTIRIPTQTVPRKPFFEEFTSSTCAPCASFNNSVFNPFIAQHGDEVVFVKYQMNWPGSGDPYYTAEGGSRKNYYGVNAVPMLFVDGKNVATSSAAVNTAFNNSLSSTAFVDIHAYYTIDGNTVSIDGSITSYADIENATLHVVVFEGITTENKRTNGETQFHHVMMCLLPDGNGSAAVLQTGVPQSINHVVDMTSTNVEEMSDLYVAVYLQDNETKGIFQAAYGGLSGALISSDPHNSATNVNIDEPITIEFSHAVRLSGGEELTNASAITVVSLTNSDAGGTPVEFSADVNPDKNIITITPTSVLQESTLYELTVAPLENFNGLATYQYSAAFTTKTITSSGLSEIGMYKAYPNPAANFVVISGVSALGKISAVSAADLSGREIMNFNPQRITADEISLSLAGLKNGIYLLSIKGDSKSGTLRLVVIN
jgi:hypothetical protein